MILQKFEPAGNPSSPCGFEGAGRTDVYDEHRDYGPIGDAVTGFPGAAGVVEGIARVVASLEEGDRLQPGEILVTTLTNVGWTPLFPRAAAVVSCCRQRGRGSCTGGVVLGAAALTAPWLPYTEPNVRVNAT